MSRKERRISVDNFAPMAPSGVPLPEKGMAFTPKGENQKKLVRYLEEGRQVVFATGVAGTGKSMIAAHHAATKLRGKSVEKVFLVRPAVAVGKSVGLLPGELKDKLAPYFAQTLTHIEKFLGKGFTKYCLDKQVIEMCAVEYLRGMSFENCIVICEESQNFTAEEFEMMLTRIGNNCTMIFTGDQKQTDLRATSGLVSTMELLKVKDYPDYLETDDMNQLMKNVGFVQFGFDDVLRSGLVKAFTKLYFYAK